MNFENQLLLVQIHTYIMNVHIVERVIYSWEHQLGIGAAAAL